MCKRLITLLTILLIGVPVFGQSFFSINRDRSFIASFGTGTATYFGEMKDDSDRFDTKINLSFGLDYQFQGRFLAGVNLAWFRLEGADADGPNPNRNLSFRSDNIELSLMGKVLALSDGDRFYQRRVLNFYGFAGLSFLWFNPKAELNGEFIALQPLMTEGVDYSRFTLTVPFGLGIKVNINPFFNIALEGGYRLAFTDYLDDVSTVHKDPASFSDPNAAALADRRPEIGLPIVPEGTKRGNPGDDDGYFLALIKIEYYLPPSFLSNIFPDKLRTIKVKPGRRR